MPEPSGGLSVLHLLLEAGAYPNRTDFLGGTPLILAVTEGTTEAISPLLVYGADANASNPAGTTTLIAAVAGGSVVSLHPLIEVAM